MPVHHHNLDDAHFWQTRRSHSKDKKQEKDKSIRPGRSLNFRNNNNTNPATSVSVTGHAVRPSRSHSRSRLQKRPSTGALKTSIGTPMMAQVSPTTHATSIDQQGLTALPQLPEQVIPQRSSSLRKKPRPHTADRPLSTKEHLEPVNERRIASVPNGILSIRPKPVASEVAPRSDYLQEEPSPSSSSSSASTSSTRSPQAPSATSQRTPRHLPLAPYDPSPLNPLYYIPSPSSSSKTHTMSTDSANPGTGSNTQPLNEHVVLPPGFKPGRSERTYVEETILPPVTQEVVKRKTTEIVQQNITRDIHVDHYYTYVQPIKVVEVLPARHFVIDEKTGEKVEIPAPEGWKMPTSLEPTKPDLSDIGPESRHYLVDEEHPQGIPEPPPQDEQWKDPQDLKAIARATHSANWSPFPKVR